MSEVVEQSLNEHSLALLKQGVQPQVEWMLDVAYLYMDGDPESTGKEENYVDGNDNIPLLLKIGDRQSVFSRRMLWCSRLDKEHFVVGFNAHPAYEWNENNNDLSEVEREVFELAISMYPNLFSLNFEDLSEEIQEEFKQEHLELFKE